MLGKIGARIHDLIQGDSARLVEELKNSEVENVQLTLPKFLLDGESRDGFSIERLKAIKQNFDEAGVKISVLSCYINPLSKDVTKGQEKFFRYVDYAKEMGVAIVGTETGSIVSDLKEFKKNHTEEVFLQLVDNFRPILEYADKRGITVGIEGVAYFPIRNEETFERFKKLFSDKSICSIFDPTNLLYIGNYQEQRKVFERFIKMHAREIRVVHLKDFVCEYNWIVERPLFEGQLDVNYVIELLKRYNVQADIIIENAPSIKAFKAMKSTVKEIIDRGV